MVGNGQKWINNKTKNQQRDTARHSRERHLSNFRINGKSPLLNVEKSYRWLPYQTHTHFGNKLCNDRPMAMFRSKAREAKKGNVSFYHLLSEISNMNHPRPANSNPLHTFTVLAWPLRGWYTSTIVCIK